MHRDLKPDNIMFSSNNDFTSLKIIDLGLAQRVGEPYIYPKCGTPGFVAPEILNFG
jgi:calcium-dependent protein kinase